MATLEDIVDHVRCMDWCGPVFDDANTGFTRNPLCGDTVNLHVGIRDGVIWRIRHESVGCIISRGCTSLLCERVEGKSVAQVLQQSTTELLDFDISQLTIHKQQCARLSYDLLQRLLREHHDEPTSDEGTST